MSRPRYGELFAGIGGMSLGLERAGWEPAWFAENDAYCSRVLAKHWPHVPNLGDVTKVDWSEVEDVELVCGGFPCQPFSLAGSRRGADDDRYLWPEVVRCLRLVRPRFALLENVPGLVTSPEFGRVHDDLADLGYDTEWDCIPAAAVGAPHLRYRLFIVAYAVGEQLREQPVSVAGRGGASAPSHDGPPRVMADRDGGRLEERGEHDRGPVEPGLETSRRDDTRGLRSPVAHAASSGRPDEPQSGNGGVQPVRTVTRPSGRARGGNPAEGVGLAGRGAPVLEPPVAYPEVFAERSGLRAGGPRGIGGRRLGDGSSAGDPWAVEPDVGFPLGWTDLEPSEMP
jgi:DNA (cytosine-5)-methyltransferase 1